ncbi:hypothetical protein M434DRAFT_7979 [Hypoxylon sp. CO27-5]|nr:hypothetical protein M434DRAFT_7979 [Hypoxylon sp. CO27-5]
MGVFRSKMGSTYTCTLNPCTRRTCVIHGRPVAYKIDAATTSETASKKPSHLQDLEGDTSESIGDYAVRSLGLYNVEQRFVLPDYEYVFGFDDKHNHRIIGDYVFGLDEKARLYASRERPLARKDYKHLSRLISRHGIQYLPEEPVGTFLSRQVIITGANPDMEAYDIMARVRGGMILRMLTATSPNPVNHTIIIDFARPNDAAGYAVYATRYSRVLWGSAKVSLTKTPSYPLSYETLGDMTSGFTRLLVFLDFTDYDLVTFLNHFKQIYRDPEEVLEDAWADDKGVLFLLFKQLSHASLFFKIIMWREEILNWGTYKSARNLWRFAPDPCDKPLPSPFLGPRAPVRAREPYFSLLEVWIENKNKGVPTTAPSLDCDNPHRSLSPLKQPTDFEVFEALEKLDGKFCNAREWNADMEHADNIVEEPTKDSISARPSSPETIHYPRAPHSTPTMERPSVQPLLLGEDFSAILSESSMSCSSPTRSSPAECSLLEAQVETEKPDYKGKGKEKQGSSTQDTSTTPSPSSLLDSQDVPDASSGEISQSNPEPNASSGPASANSTILATPHRHLLAEECEDLIPKYMLPQNDPAYYELLNREPTDLVSLAEAKAIFAKQPFRTIPMAEMRARYSAFIRVRDQMAAWDRGEEYDPDAPVKEPGRNFL